MTIPDAAETLGVTPRTIQRRIKAGKMETRTENGQRLVCVELRPPNDDETTVSVQMLLDEKDSRISELSKQNDDLRQRVAELNQLLALAQEGVLRLTEQNQLLLEDLRPKRRWYHRLLTWNTT